MTFIMKVEVKDASAPGLASVSKGFQQTGKDAQAAGKQYSEAMKALDEQRTRDYASAIRTLGDRYQLSDKAAAGFAQQAVSIDKQFRNQDAIRSAAKDLDATAAAYDRVNRQSRAAGTGLEELSHAQRRLAVESAKARDAMLGDAKDGGQGKYNQELARTVKLLEEVRAAELLEGVARNQSSAATHGSGGGIGGAVRGAVGFAGNVAANAAGSGVAALGAMAIGGYGIKKGLDLMPGDGGAVKALAGFAERRAGIEGLRYALGGVAATLGEVAAAAYLADKAVGALEKAGSQSAKTVKEDMRAYGKNLTEGLEVWGKAIHEQFRAETYFIRQQVEWGRTAAREFDQTFSKYEGFLTKAYRLTTGGKSSPEEIQRGEDLNSKLDGPRGLTARVRGRDRKAKEDRDTEDDIISRSDFADKNEAERKALEDTEKAERKRAETLDSGNLVAEAAAARDRLRRRDTRAASDRPTDDQAKQMQEADETAKRKGMGADAEVHDKVRGLPAYTTPEETERQRKIFEQEANAKRAQFEAERDARKKEIMRPPVRNQEQAEAINKRTKDAAEGKIQDVSDDLARDEQKIRDENTPGKFALPGTRKELRDKAAEEIRAAKAAAAEKIKLIKEEADAKQKAINDELAEQQKLDAADKRIIEQAKERVRLIKEESKARREAHEAYEEDLSKARGKFQEELSDKSKQGDLNLQSSGMDKAASRLRAAADRDRSWAQANVDRSPLTAGNVAAEPDSAKRSDRAAADLERKSYELQKGSVQKNLVENRGALVESEQLRKAAQKEVEIAKTKDEQLKAEKELVKARERELDLIAKVKNDESRLLSIEQQRTRELQAQKELEADRAEMARVHAQAVFEAQGREKEQKYAGMVQGAVQSGAAGQGLDPENVNLVAVNDIAEQRGSEAANKARDDANAKGQYGKAADRAADKARRAAEAKTWKAAKRQGIVRGGARDAKKVAKAADKALANTGKQVAQGKAQASGRGDIAGDELAKSQGDVLGRISQVMNNNGIISDEMLKVVQEALKVASEQGQMQAKAQAEINTLKAAFSALQEAMAGAAQDNSRKNGWRP